MKYTGTTIGKSEQRVDVVGKATGKVKYVGDYHVPGLLHAKLVTSTEAHASLKKRSKRYYRSKKINA